MSANKSRCWFGKFIRATATEADPVSSPRRGRPLDRRRDSNDLLPDRLSLRHVNFFRLFAIKFDEGPLQVVEEGVTRMSDHRQVLWVVPYFQRSMVIPGLVR